MNPDSTKVNILLFEINGAVILRLNEDNGGVESSLMFYMAWHVAQLEEH